MSRVSRGHSFQAGETEHGERLDRFLARHLPGHSRTEIARWIRQGQATVMGQAARVAHRLRAGDVIQVTVPPPRASELTPEPMDLQVLHEDDQILVLVKPAGLVVHPGAGVRTGTLVHALLARGERWSTIGGEVRPGIVHRLDRATSGLMVVARTDAAHRSLTAQFKERVVEKGYLAAVLGSPAASRGRIQAPIGRHRVHRARMAVRDDGREAQTRYQILENLGPLTHLSVSPLTGRTHQIRVHLASLGHPIAGDRLYGGVARARGLGDPAVRRALTAFGRLALHAARLRFQHPASGREMAFEASPPPDYDALLRRLREASR